MASARLIMEKLGASDRTQAVATGRSSRDYPVVSSTLLFEFTPKAYQMIPNYTAISGGRSQLVYLFRLCNRRFIWDSIGRFFGDGRLLCSNLQLLNGFRSSAG
jgi:hypothetical protein